MSTVSKNKHTTSAGGFYKEAVSFITIDEDSAGQRLDGFLCRLYVGVPKSHIYRLLRSGEVRVNKGRKDGAYRLLEADIVRVPPMREGPASQRDQVRAPATSHFPPLDLPILYEDESLLVVDKPSGMAVHGGSGIRFGVIEKLRQARPDARFLELVHRLDRETSGILLIAKKRQALVTLHEQFRNNQIDKRYLACVWGAWSLPTRVVELPLYKYVTADGERRVRVQEEGKASKTIFRLIQRFAGYALLEAQLKTGRTHQIRVHLAEIRTPIIGDEKYGDFSLNREWARPGAQPGLKRMFLHAYKLSLRHPVTGVTLKFEAPLPKDCERFLQQCPRETTLEVS